jgi:hypothetical protein
VVFAFEFSKGSTKTAKVNGSVGSQAILGFHFLGEGMKKSHF